MRRFLQGAWDDITTFVGVAFLMGFALISLIALLLLEALPLILAGVVLFGVWWLLFAA